VTEELEKAQNLLASGDVPGLLQHLRTEGAALPLGVVARLVAGAAAAAGFDDLAQAAAVVAAGGYGPTDGDALAALYKYGYACLDRGAAYLAVGPLERALELVPDAVPVLGELVAALEQDGRRQWNRPTQGARILRGHDGPGTARRQRYQDDRTALGQAWVPRPRPERLRVRPGPDWPNRARAPEPGYDHRFRLSPDNQPGCGRPSPSCCDASYPVAPGRRSVRPGASTTAVSTMRVPATSRSH
jgi:hypothetical protein